MSKSGAEVFYVSNRVSIVEMNEGHQPLFNLC